jgi:hypothetical protein
MQNHQAILHWANDLLAAKGYSLSHAPEIVVDTPWSHVIRLATATATFYLKQTPPALFLEPKILQLLASQLNANVPIVIASNENLHGFLMKDAGQSLRGYLKTEPQPELLCQAVVRYTALQRSAENHTKSFLALGVPDWRLDKLPQLYQQLISQTAFLKSEGLIDQELQLLHNLIPKVSQLCQLLSQYQIPESIVQPDFNTNNTLIDPNTQKMAFIDWGEIVITHPFFSLHNFLYQVTIHHGIKQHDEIYLQLQSACFENWLTLASKTQLLEAFRLVQSLWPIYATLAHYRLMMSVDLQAFSSYYADRPSRIREYLRQFAA